MDDLWLKDAVLQKPPPCVTLTTADLEALLGRVPQSNVAPVDAEVVEQVLRSDAWVTLAIAQACVNIKQLRRLLLGPGRTDKEQAASETSSPSSDGATLGEDGDEPTPVNEAHPGTETVVGAVDPGTTAPQPTGGHRQGTGRLGAAAYGGATRVECRHEELAVGQRCPVCGQGTLDQLPAGVEIRIDGHALLSALHYEREKLRCSACGGMFTAALPAGVGAEKYSARARAVLAVSRYDLGVPGYRLQGYQAMLGVPAPDATQWDQIEVVGDCAYKVFEQMEHEAAQGELVFHDDTAVRIVSLMQENRARLAAAEARDGALPPERTGMHTTALVVKVGEHTVILYYSSRQHAGENLGYLYKAGQFAVDRVR